MTLGRAATLAFFVHLCFAFTVAFSFNASGWHDASVSYWGSIVRKEEFSPRMKRGLSGNAGTASAGLIPLEARQATWRSGVSIDKPTILSAVQSEDFLEKIKFSGPKVVLDDGAAASSGPPIFDLPVPVDVRLRYPRS